ncbi:MAG: catechol 1,2-dioxygenase [Alphaproteobacteria bacterium]|nr:MAG: catechol 1,2-dioxygenase [Alphaproteobacteria bacterium]
MGEVVGAGLVSHVPTIMLPKETRLQINEGKEISLVTGFQRLRAEVLDVLRPDTIIVFDTHWATTVEFVVTAHARRAGKYTSEELPRGMRQVPYDLKGNPALAHEIASQVRALGTPCTPIDDPYLPIHYPTVNLAHYLNRGEEWLSIGMCQTADTDDNLTVGRGVGAAIARSDRRVVLLASGSMSHIFYPLKELAKHEASDPKHIFSPQARAADEQRLKWFAQGDHAAVIDGMDAFYAYKPEGRFGHYLMMVAAIGGRACKAKGRLFSDYENSVGTSQVHVWFDRPEGGWTGA